MTRESAQTWVDEWCDLAAADADELGPDIYTEVNAAWEAARPDHPRSLLQALAKDEERLLSALIDEQVDQKNFTPDWPALAALHRIFVSEFNPAKELESCRPEVATVMAINDDHELRRVLADLTRAGIGSPLHLVAHRAGDHGAVVVPTIHAAPLPPGDFDVDDRVDGYVRHMSAMVRHIGGSLSAEQVAGVVSLDRALWGDPPPTEVPGGHFPWKSFLRRAVGTQTEPWTSHVQPETGQRMAAWWAGTVEQKRDWMLCRIAFDLGPFVSEEALVQNSTFFARRILGIKRTRRRRERFVSFVKTVAPGTLAELYVGERRDEPTLRLARDIVDDLRREALAWTVAIHGPGADYSHDKQRIRDLVVELGEQPSAPAAPDHADSTGASVCHLVMQARSVDVARRLALIDAPWRDADWKIQPFTAVAYYQRSSNKVVVPWALMREPVLGPELPRVQAYAVFGALVAHEMAHALLPTSSADWSAFISRTSLHGVMEQFAAATRSIPGYVGKATHMREVAADALGFLWAYKAFGSGSAPFDDAEAGSDAVYGDDPAPIDRQFLRYWATRWRGAQPVGGEGFAHIDHHPPTQLRCNIPPTYAGPLRTSASAPALERI